MLTPPKLVKLAKIEGFTDTTAFISSIVIDSVIPGICTNQDCDYSTSVEPDQDKGWCDVCNAGTVKSALMLAGLV